MAASDKFMHTEILRTEPKEAKLMLLDALNAIAREDGWTTLPALGSQTDVFACAAQGGWRVERLKSFGKNRR